MLCFGISHKVIIKVSARALVISVLDKGSIGCQVHSSPAGFNSLSVVGLLCSVPAWQVCFIKARKLRSQLKQSASKMEVAVFCNLIRKVTSHHLCHILLVRSKSLVKFTLKKRGDNTQAWILRDWNHRRLSEKYIFHTGSQYSHL